MDDNFDCEKYERERYERLTPDQRVEYLRREAAGFLNDIEDEIADEEDGDVDYNPATDDENAYAMYLYANAKLRRN